MALNLNYSPEVIVQDIRNLSEEQWKAYRRKGIGGSDAAAACGVSPWKTARDLYWEKTRAADSLGDEDNWVAKEIGKRLEELVVQIFMKRTGYEPYAIRKMFRHPLFPFMLANVDYFVNINGQIYIIECKTSFSYSMGEWEDNAIPYHYELQGRHYMAVLNVSGVIFLCLYGNNEDTFLMRMMKRDLKLEEELIRQEAHYWKNHVEKGIEPAYTERADLVIESIRRHMPVQEGKQVTLSGNLSGNVLSYLQMKERKSRLEEQARKVEEQMKLAYVPVQEAMNGAEKGVITIGSDCFEAGYSKRVTTSINRNNLEALKLEYPEICGKFAETKTTRSFYIKAKKAG